VTDLPPGPFGCLLVDPPWSFKTYSGEGVPTQGPDPYAVLSIDDLKELPVASVAAADCALILWYSGTHADQAIDLGRAWGFRFVRSELFVWVKTRREEYAPKKGMGYWTRNGAECAMLFTRGSPKRLSRAVDQVILCPRGAHSAKPDATYERIEALVGGPYLEMFARSRRPGWSSWGREVGVRDGSLFAEPLDVEPVGGAIVKG
jgi:N6-adenosine-specific RNA methylase IME4